MKIAARFASCILATAVAGCGVPASKAGDLHGFASEKTTNLFGYYMPVGEVRFGKFALNNLALGEPADFRKFESGGYKGTPYAPVMLEFDDRSSPKKQGETGEYYANAPRVLPSSYRVRGNSVTFIGNDKQLGVVTFAGTLDVAAVKAAQNGGRLEKPVLKGDLTVGTKTTKNVTFTWFGGD